MSLQGENTKRMSRNDKMIGLFSELDEFMEENELSVNIVKKSITTHLQALLKHFNSGNM